METDYLIHYGMPKRSGRFPWGSGKRPFQSGGGPVGKAVRYVRKKKSDKRRKENLAKARAKAAENRKLAADKDRVLKSGSASEVMRYKGKISNQELSDAVRRLELEAKLTEMSKKEIATNMQKIDHAMKTLKTANDWMATGIKTWNQITDVYNSTPEGRRHPLGRIDAQQSQQRRIDDDDRRAS